MLGIINTDTEISVGLELEIKDKHGQRQYDFIFSFYSRGIFLRVVLNMDNILGTTVSNAC